MTKRVTVSLPDDVAERLEQQPNASAYVAAALQNQIDRDDTRAVLAEHGFALTEKGRQRAQERLAAVRAKMSPERYDQLRAVGKRAA